MRKTIFITGAGSGIGRATARLFAEKSWLVGLGDINAATIDETAALLPDGSFSKYVMDVRKPADWERALADFTSANGGRLDVMVNNAGIAVGGPLEDISAEDVVRVVDINVTGMLLGAREALSYLKATPGSALVSISSAAGIYAGANFAAYSATKFAIRAMSESLSREWAGDGIRVRAIMPGFIDTPMLDTMVAGSDDNMREAVRKGGFEFTPVEQVAEAIWAAIEGDKVHMLIGRTARRLAAISRWKPRQSSGGAHERVL